MKKGYFIVNGELTEDSGVTRKICSQIDTFNQNGLFTTPYVVKIRSDVKGYKILYRLPFSNLSPRWKISKSLGDADYIYMRRPFFCNIWFLRFLKAVKQMNPAIKIIYEIPSYPYDIEIIRDKRNLPLYIKDIIARRQLYKYVDRIATLSNVDVVYGVKTLHFNNGYDFSEIFPKKYTKHDSINIAAVALFDTWHGYDRLILGLSNYYKNGGKAKFNIHFAGDGPELENYKNLAAKMKVPHLCFFYGMQNIDQLNILYDKCDIGASCFGLFRKKVSTSSELKSREYLGKGLPIICACKLDAMDIPELKDYFLRFQNNDSMVDFFRIERFYKKLYSEKKESEVQNMIDCIRKAAQNNYAMFATMKEIIEYIKE